MKTLAPPIALHEALEHEMVQDLAEYVARQQRYAYWGAAQLWRDGRRAGLYQLVAHPSWRFIRTYLLQRGFLEGVPGLTMCLLQAWASHLKWATLWSWQRAAATGDQPILPLFDDDERTWVWPPPDKKQEVEMSGGPSAAIAHLPRSG
jgi:hypothetical protein